MLGRVFIKGLHLRAKLTKEPLKKNPLNTVGWFCMTLLGKVSTTCTGLEHQASQDQNAQRTAATGEYAASPHHLYGKRRAVCFASGRIGRCQCRLLHQGITWFISSKNSSLRVRLDCNSNPVLARLICFIWNQIHEARNRLIFAEFSQINASL